MIQFGTYLMKTVITMKNNKEIKKSINNHNKTKNN